MATTDQVPPIADELPTPVPEKTGPAETPSSDATHAADKGYRQPEVDVAALRTLLDGKYAEVRDLVRDNLAEHAQILLDMSQYLRAIMAQRLVPGADGRRVAAVEIMLNTPHIADLMRKGDVSAIKEAIQLSGEKGIQSFDASLVQLFKAGRVSLDDALANADSRSNLEAKINFG